MITGQLQTKCLCPRCKNVIDGFFAEDDRPPQSNDLTVCSFCFVLLVYLSPASVRTLTTVETAELTWEELKGIAHAREQAKAFRASA